MKKGVKKEEKIISIVLFIMFMILLIIPLASAGFFNWIKKITGQATSREANMSVTISGDNQAVVEYIYLDPNNVYTPVENATRSLQFYVQVSDADGVNDINDSGTMINATVTDTATEPVRQNSSCKNLTDIDGTTANFSCIITMWYWDKDGEWNVSASAVDLGNLNRAHNNTGNNFSYSLLRALTINPGSLFWGSVAAGASNSKATSNMTINNTGNYNGTINATAINLGGASITDEYIYAENFTVGVEDHCDQTGVNATFLSNNTAVVINNTGTNRGNRSAGYGNETIYWCIPSLATILSSQAYSTNNTGYWSVSYLSA